LIAEIPKVAIGIGKGIGFGYFFMSPSDPEGITLCWPNVQIAYLGPEGGVHVLHRREIAKSENPRELVEKLAAPYRAEMNPWRAARIGWIDDIIDPADTRPMLVRSLEALRRRGAHGEA
jgi:acetyl-CoA carboxylase carboxyltransferase component